LPSALIGIDLVIGALTQIRVRNASVEDLAHVIGMNRLRAAYVEFDPSIERYLVTSPHDDPAGVWQTYNHLQGPNASQRFASSAAFIMFLNSGLTAALVALAGMALAIPGAFIASAAARRRSGTFGSRRRCLRDATTGRPLATCRDSRHPARPPSPGAAGPAERRARTHRRALRDGLRSQLLVAGNDH
jgi:hypothetical protein